MIARAAAGNASIFAISVHWRWREIAATHKITVRYAPIFVNGAQNNVPLIHMSIANVAPKAVGNVQKPVGKW